MKSAALSQRQRSHKNGTQHPRLQPVHRHPDLIFIDADKESYPEYLRQSLPLLREGGLLLGDNTLPDAVFTEEYCGTKEYNAAVATHPELTSIVIPILRQHGIDGLTVSFKRTPVI